MQIARLNLDNNIFLAPMAGITDLPYRLIMKRFGAGLVYSEMVSANGLIRDGRRTAQLLRSCEEERPLAIQLFGDRPEILAEAARRIDAAEALLDLNLGCPVPKVVRSGAGSALLRDLPRVAAILRALRQAWQGPLTIKIRSGWGGSSLNFREVGRIAVEEGIDAITLHPRTRAQGFSGKADWTHIAQLVAAVPIPVVGSGDIFTAEDGLALLATTGCRAVMVGRGGYGNPWLIRELRARQRGESPSPPSAAERLATVRDHLDLHCHYFGAHRAVRDMRKHLCWYARGLAGAAPFRTQVNQTDDLPRLRELIDDFFGRSQPAAPQEPRPLVQSA